MCLVIKPLWLIYARRRRGYVSTLFHVMTFCLITPSHCIKQCWLFVKYQFENAFQWGLSNLKRFHSRKYIWKCCPHNRSIFFRHGYVHGFECLGVVHDIMWCYWNELMKFQIIMQHLRHMEGSVSFKLCVWYITINHHRYNGYQNDKTDAGKVAQAIRAQ